MPDTTGHMTGWKVAPMRYLRGSSARRLLQVPRYESQKTPPKQVFFGRFLTCFPSIFAHFWGLLAVFLTFL